MDDSDDQSISGDSWDSCGSCVKEGIRNDDQRETPRWRHLSCFILEAG